MKRCRGTNGARADSYVLRSRFATPLLSLAMLFCFLLLAALAWSLKERALPDLFKTQLREHSRDVLLVNILFGALPAVIAMVFGPILGTFSDRARTRLGRRIPFLLACTPMISVSIAFLAYSQPIADYLWEVGGLAAKHRDTVLVAWMCLCWTIYELFTILANALFIGLINDTVPQHVLGRFFGMLRIVSLAVGVAFFYLIFSNDLPHITRSVLLAIAVFYLASFLVLCAVVREPGYPPPEPVIEPALLTIYTQAKKTDGFHMLLFTAVAIGSLCVLPININSYAALAQFGIDRSSYGQAVAIAYSISILLALPIGWLADRYHPLLVGYVVLALYALCMLGAFALVRGSVSFLLWLVVHSVLGGAFVTGTSSLLPVLLPKAHFSALAALSASITALLTVVVTIILGALLGWNGSDFRIIFLFGGLLAAIGTVCWHGLLQAHQRRTQGMRP